MRDLEELAQRVGQVECDVLNAADAICGYASMDFGLIRGDLAKGMQVIFLEGEERVLRDAAEELAAIFGELHKLAEI